MDTQTLRFKAKRTQVEQNYSVEFILMLKFIEEMYNNMSMGTTKEQMS